MFIAEIWKYQIYFSEFFQINFSKILEVNFSIYLNRHVFIMWNKKTSFYICIDELSEEFRGHSKTNCCYFYYFYITEADDDGSAAFFGNLDFPNYQGSRNSLSNYDNSQLNPSAEKRFWTNRFWPILRSYRTRQWPYSNNKIDRFRFVMKGLGKRSGLLEDLDDNDDVTERNYSICENCENGEISSGLGPVAEAKASERSFKDNLSRAGTYSDILNSLNKRTPEIYRQDWYPIQGGTQRMEVEMDRKLDELMLDNVIESDDNILSNDEDDFNHFDSTDSHIRDVDNDTNNIYRIDNTELSLDGGKRGGNEEKSKRWWAARRLKLFGLKTPKSIRGRRYGRPHIDPVLYLIGLGRWNLFWINFTSHNENTPIQI